MAETSQKFAVVTGANKGIGFEIVRQLASNGVRVVLTARDEKRGLEALHKLNEFSDKVVFHQLDVADSSSIASLANFVNTQFGKLDILVNNAGVPGGVRAPEKFAIQSVEDLLKSVAQTYKLAEECLQINYYGAKSTTEALIPFLQSSNSPRVVNVSSSRGQLCNIPHEWAKTILGDGERLTDDRIDEVLQEFLKDIKEGPPESKDWPVLASAYTLSKAAMIAHTRVLAKKHPRFRINSVCPGYVKTDITFNTGVLTTEEGAASPVRLALLPDDGPSGLFFYRSEVASF